MSRQSIIIEKSEAPYCDCTFNPFPPVDADCFRKHRDKRRNATMFSTFFGNNTYNYRDFLYFCIEVFKVVCCRFYVCGKGLHDCN